MNNGYTIRVFFSSRTIGGFKGREDLFPVCHACDKKLGKKNNFGILETIPEEVTPLLFSAKLAAQELNVNLELIDVTRLPLRVRLQEMMNGKPVPRVDIGSDFLIGIPTKQQIIELFNSRIER